MFYIFKWIAKDHSLCLVRSSTCLVIQAYFHFTPLVLIGIFFLKLEARLEAVIFSYSLKKLNRGRYFKLDKEFYAVTTKENVDIDFINFHFFHFLKIYSVKTIISRKCWKENLSMSNSEAREYIDFALKQRKDNQPSNTSQVQMFRSEFPRKIFLEWISR